MSKAVSGVPNSISSLAVKFSLNLNFNFLAACFEGTTMSVFPDSLEISYFKKAFASSISGSSQPRKNLLMLINTLLTGFVPQVNKAR